MTSKQIEEMATTAVKQSILLTDLLDQYIAENDKEPSWDGKVYIYKNEKKHNGDFIGRVDVQIKGKTSDNPLVDKIKYSVKIDDLQNYLKDKGVIYFVVLISKDKQSTKIFYKALTPIIIKRILDKTNNKHSISLEFNTFPKDNNDKVNLFLDFNLNSQRQISFVNNKLLKIEDLEKEGEKIEIVQTVHNYGGNDQASIFRKFLNNEICLYAKMHELFVPVDEDAKVYAIAESIKTNIFADGKKYYSSYKRIHTKNSIICKIGESFQLIYTKPEEPLTIKIIPASMLSQRITDTEFIIDAFDKCNMSIGELSFDLSRDKLSKKNINIDDMRKHLCWCKKISNLFLKLNIKDDLNMENLNQDDQLNLECLIEAIVDNKVVKLKKANNSRYLYFKIKQITILLYANEEIPGSGEYRLWNIFNGKIIIDLLFNGETKMAPYPTYTLLKRSHYSTAANINYDLLLDQYKSISLKNNRLFEKANLDALEMVAAYDMCKKPVLLNTAISIFEWIMKDGIQNESDKANYQLNILQSIARLRELNDEEINILTKICVDSTSSVIVKFASSVLLKHTLMAKEWFGKLSKTDKIMVKSWPIYTIYEMQI